MENFDFRLYDIGMDFSTNKERVKIYAFQASIKVATDMLMAPWEYSTESYELIKKSLQELLNELENNLISLESDYHEDYIFRLHHLMNIFVLGENRFQELDNLTLKYMITAHISSLIDLVQVLEHQLEEIALTDIFTTDARVFENDKNELQRLALEVDLIRARIGETDESSIVASLNSFFIAEKKDFKSYFENLEKRLSKYTELTKNNVQKGEESKDTDYDIDLILKVAREQSENQPPMSDEDTAKAKASLDELMQRTKPKLLKKL